MKPGWTSQLADTMARPEVQELRNRLRDSLKAGQQIWPPARWWLRCFDDVDIDDVRVCIVGQDPYHTPGAANGRAFAVNPGQPAPPSLHNIFREVEQDTKCNRLDRAQCDLSGWVEQGVFLMNTCLTVEAGKPNSHRGFGWDIVTNAAIEALNRRAEPVVFMLWGAYAKARGAQLDPVRHLILEAGHPSPLSQQGFFGCRHFSRANEFFETKCVPRRPVIDWTRTKAFHTEEMS